MKNHPKEIFINGIGAISPQRTEDNHTFLSEITHHEGNVLKCLSPDLKPYLTPAQMRRLGRMMRLGLVAAAISMQDARLSKLDAVVMATGWGCQEDMGKFLLEMLQQDEQYVTPTHFIQSTYNVLAGAIAMSLHCTGYNSTYAGRGFSFENAIDDAMIHLREDESCHVLVGAFDEASPIQQAEQVRTGRLKQEAIDHLQLFESTTTGTLQGEGAAMFVFSSVPGPHHPCRFKDLRMVYKPVSYEDLAAQMDDFLRINGLASGDVDVYIDGVSGDIEDDRMSQALFRDYFRQPARVRFKHLTGEYATASSFALWLAAMILRHGTIPDALGEIPEGGIARIEKILICNHFLGKYYSFMLLEK